MLCKIAMVAQQELKKRCRHVAQISTTGWLDRLAWQTGFAGLGDSY